MAPPASRVLMWASLCAGAAALDVRWTPGPQQDPRGNSFSARERFRDLKPGEKLPDHYYPDEATEAPSVTTVLMYALTGVLVIAAAASWWIRAHAEPGEQLGGGMPAASATRPSTSATVPNAEALRQARLARFGDAAKVD